MNPRGKKSAIARFRELDAEVRVSRTHDVAAQGVRERLAATAVDRANA